MKYRVDVDFFISLNENTLTVELYQLEHDFRAQFSISFDGSKNTPYGFLLKNGSFKRFVDDSERQFGVSIGNSQIIAKAIATYIMLYGPSDSVINYLVFSPQSASQPVMTNTYTNMFTPLNMVVNISSFKCLLDNIDFSVLRHTLEASNHKDGYIVTKSPQN
jgi:hypothetical protein